MLAFDILYLSTRDNTRRLINYFYFLWCDGGGRGFRRSTVGRVRDRIKGQGYETSKIGTRR